MSRVTGKPPTHWRRPMTRTYDYNMSLGENYYKPQLEYLSSRKGRGNTPPTASTFAERLLKYPPSRRSASASRRAEEAELGLSSLSSSTSTAVRDARESLGRYASLDDLGLDEDLSLRRRKQLLSLQASQENLAADRGVSPLLSPVVERKSRVTFGEKMLDAIGVKDVQSKTTQQKSSLFSAEDGDVLDKILAERRNRRQQALTVQTADADLFTEDPLKSPKISSRIQQARQEMDHMREEMKKDADASTSRFRNRLRAKREREAREEQEFGSTFGGSLSALNDFSSPLTPSSATASSAMSKAFSAAASSSSASKATSTMRVTSSSMQNLLAAEAAECDAETEAILSKVDQIRKRAKARLAQIGDDFPDLQIESSLASRRAAKSRQAMMDDEFDSDLMSSSRLANNSGRAVTITKKTLRTSFDVE